MLFGGLHSAFNTALKGGSNHRLDELLRSQREWWGEAGFTLVWPAVKAWQSADLHANKEVVLLAETLMPLVQTWSAHPC